MSTITKIAGLKNIGNSCYLNSVLQSLFSSELLNEKLIRYIRENNECINEFSPLLIEYCKIFSFLIDESKEIKILSPTNFKKILDNEFDRFAGQIQCDAHELFVYIMDNFMDQKKNNKYSKKINKLCFGKYKQHLYCSECKNSSESYFNFFDVILPIPLNKQNIDLEDCFKKFAKYDTLDTDNKWNCPTCSKKVIAYKKMEIDIVPDISVFTFNRFEGMKKNNNSIKLYEYIELEGKKLKLISTVNHYGNIIGGHYISYVSRNKKWFRTDDSNITEVSMNDVLNDNSSVYMVIYQVDK